MYLITPPSILKKYYGPEIIWEMPVNGKKQLFLTFDDGPHPDVTPQVLELLEEYNAKATFFCVGENVERFPKIFEAIIARDHKVGNHTYSHKRGWSTSTFNYLEDVSSCAKLVKSSLFRPPYGMIKPSQIKALQANYKIIMWNVLSVDYDKNTSPEKCLHNVIHHAIEGSIVVFHDSEKARKNILYALPKTLEHFSKQEFQFSYLSEN